MDESKLAPAPLAYQNEPFLNSPDGRILRILAEYSEPVARFRREQIQDTVVFFGSARFHGLSTAQKALAELERKGATDPETRKRALAALDMARYYEDARRESWKLRIWVRRKRGARLLG